MERRVCQSIIKTLIYCIPKTNTVDKGNSSSTQVDAARLGFVCGLICIKCNITMVHDGRWRSTQDLKTTNFHRLPCKRKAQSGQIFS